MNQNINPLKPNFFMNKFNVELANAIVQLDNKINTTFDREDEDLDEDEESSSHPLSGYAYMCEDTWITCLYPKDQAWHPFIDWETKTTFKQFLLNPEVKALADVIGKVTIVDSHGGREGGGEEVFRVYHFKEWDLYIEFYGSYFSYEGSRYEGCRQVIPKAKTAYDWIPV